MRVVWPDDSPSPWNSLLLGELVSLANINCFGEVEVCFAKKALSQRMRTDSADDTRADEIGVCKIPTYQLPNSPTPQLCRIFVFRVATIIDRILNLFTMRFVITKTDAMTYNLKSSKPSSSIYRIHPKYLLVPLVLQINCTLSNTFQRCQRSVSGTVLPQTETVGVS